MGKQWMKLVGGMLVLLPVAVHAHPVIYKGGVVVQTTLRPRMALFESHYSLTSRVATGGTYAGLRLLDREVEFGFANVNFLLKRFNRAHSQGNVYISAGGGAAWDSVQGNSLAGTAAVMADYETRRIYTAAMVRGFKSRSLQTYLAQYRFGVAPYLGSFDELNTWFVLQLDYSPDLYTRVQVTPLMRFFYKSALWEFGASMRGSWWLQLMVHY